jgi:hypothetical protein
MKSEDLAYELVLELAVASSRLRLGGAAAVVTTQRALDKALDLALDLEQHLRED